MASLVSGLGSSLRRCPPLAARFAPIAPASARSASFSDHSQASRLEEVPFDAELQNRVTLTGNVGKLTLKRADDGHQQLFISLAINRPNSSTMW